MVMNSVTIPGGCSCMQWVLLCPYTGCRSHYHYPQERTEDVLQSEALVNKDESQTALRSVSRSPATAFHCVLVESRVLNGWGCMALAK
jgi:hypothetical protein